MSEKQKNSLTNKRDKTINRRQFIVGAGAAALSFAVIKPALVRGAEANSKISMGIIGCGGRGTWIAKLFRDHGGYNIIAAADYFQGQLDKFKGEIGAADLKQYTGLSGYKRMLDTGGIDVVVVESPAYFHPQQASDAVDAGKHVYVAKPSAIDVWGCNLVQKSGEKARSKKLVFLVDFQTRVQPLFVEALKRVHEGAIGDMVFGEATYHDEEIFKEKYDDWKQRSADPEKGLRAWQLDKVLSGDIIVEQNIHTLDVMSWIMSDKPPVCATGTGGRKVRKAGDVSDHFALLFEYPNKIGITFNSRQIDGYDTKPDGIRNRMFGSEGVLETAYGGNVRIRGKNFYRGGVTTDIYKEGAVNNIKAFHDSVIDGKYDNSTVAPSVQSNMVAILGRTAAYEGRTVTWNELLKSNQKLEADLKGLKD